MSRAPATSALISTFVRDIPQSLLIGQELDRHTPIIGPSPPARYR